MGEAAKQAKSKAKKVVGDDNLFYTQSLLAYVLYSTVAIDRRLRLDRQMGWQGGMTTVDLFSRASHNVERKI